MFLGEKKLRALIKRGFYLLKSAENKIRWMLRGLVLDLVIKSFLLLSISDKLHVPQANF